MDVQFRPPTWYPFWRDKDEVIEFKATSVGIWTLVCENGVPQYFLVVEQAVRVIDFDEFFNHPWEIPSGKVESTDPELYLAALRELLEETGYEFDEIKSLGKISANPSTNTNLMHMFLATGGRKTKGQSLDANEEIDVYEISFEELTQLIDENKIMQSMHLSTIYYALKSLGKLSFK